MTKFRPRRNQPRAWLGVFGISALVAVMLAGAGTASADVDSLSGRAYALRVSTSLLGELIPPTPDATGMATEPTDSFDSGPKSSVPVNIPGILFSGTLNSRTFGSGLAGENHFATVASRASVEDLVIGAGAITVDALEATCTSSGEGSTGAVELVGAVAGGRPLLQSPAANTPITIPGIAEIVINEQQKVDVPGSFTRISVNALRISLLPSPLGGPAVADIVVGHVECRADGPDVLVTTTPPTAPPTTAPPTTGPATTAPATTAPATTAPPTTKVGATTTTKGLAFTGSNTSRPLTAFAISATVLGTLLWFGGAPEGPSGPGSRQRRRHRWSH